MAEHFLPGTPEVPLTLRRSARARRISLRISQLDRRVTLTLPKGVPETVALDFAEEKADWIRRNLDDLPDLERPGWDSVLPIDGRDLRIVPATGRRVQVQGDEIAVPGPDVAPRLQSWLRTLARERLVAACDLYSERLGKPYTRITLRDTRSRWGSCSSEGALMFSWRLILAPPSVLAYVAAHEIAHLAEMNHSAAFWAQVDRIHGPYDAQRKWLRVNGAQLHRYQFGRAG